MYAHRIRHAAEVILIVVTVFNAASAVGGGIAMLATDGLGMPAEFLSVGPFSSFLGPSLILLGIVGGTQACAAILLLRRRPTALLWCSIAGFGMLIWIVVEVVIIRAFAALQVLHFTTGGAQLALVIALLGVVSWFPRTSTMAPAAETPHEPARFGSESRIGA